MECRRFAGRPGLGEKPAELLRSQASLGGVIRPVGMPNDAGRRAGDAKLCGVAAIGLVLLEQQGRSVVGGHAAIRRILKKCSKRVLAGQADDGEVTVSVATLDRSRREAAVKDNIKIDPGDRTWYLSMAMNLPPFDDLAVRSDEREAERRVRVREVRRRMAVQWRSFWRARCSTRLLSPALEISTLMKRSLRRG